MIDYTGEITKINNKGLGIVQDDSGRPLIEVPFSLPGEVVHYKSDKEGLIKSVVLIKSSEHRTKPSCPQFEKCGGCSLQHASEKFVSGWKEEVVSEALRKRNISSPFKSISISSNFSRRRAAFSARRTKKGTIVGFNERNSENIISVGGCVVLHPLILKFIVGLEKITAVVCSRSGRVKFFVSTSQNGLDVVVEGGKKINLNDVRKLTSIARDYNLARLSWDGELIALLSSPDQKISGIKVLPPDKFFMQTSKEAEEVMVRDVLEALDNAKNVADLFSGLGTFTLPIARSMKVISFESSPKMLKSLDIAYKNSSGLKPIKTIVRNLYKNPVKAKELHTVDAVIINPPRAGAEAQVKELVKSNISKIISISCNPETFARDSEILVRGGYRLEWLRVVDQFRYSHHIELIAKFIKIN